MMYADIIPDDFQILLINLRDRGTRDAWLIGDITQRVIEFNEANGRAFDTMLVYQAVGSFVGSASRTVREKHYIARFFDLEIREQFSVLSFSHFAIAARLGPEKAIQALQWCVEVVDKLNRPATVDCMEAKFMMIPQPPMPEAPPEEGEQTHTQIYRLTSQILNLSGNWEVEDEELREAVDKLKKSCIETLQVCERVMADER
jgi:hypothetical protein